MQMLEITAHENGAHRNQTGRFIRVPTGWAIVPENMELPDSFPFVDIEVEGQAVTQMTAREVPPTPEPEPVVPTAEERLSALEGAMLAMMEVQNV